MTVKARERIARYGSLLAIAQTMPKGDSTALHAWEQVHLGKEATSDWPGWKRLGLSDDVLPVPLRHKPHKAKLQVSPLLRWAVWERDRQLSLDAIGVACYDATGWRLA